MDMAVTRGFFPGTQRLFHFRNGRAVVFNEGLDTLGFRFHLQKCLFEIQIHWQFVGQVKRDQWLAAVDGDIFSQNIKKLLVELRHGIEVGRSHLCGFIVKIQDLTLQKRPLLAQLDNLKTLLAFGHDIDASIVIFLADVEDHCRASDLGEFVLIGAHHPERPLLFQAFIHHLFVTRLKNMQWQGGPWKEHDIKRKEGQQAHCAIL